MGHSSQKSSPGRTTTSQKATPPPKTTTRLGLDICHATPPRGAESSSFEAQTGCNVVLGNVEALYKATYTRGLLRPSVSHIITAPGYLSVSQATAIPGQDLNLHRRDAHLRGAACSSRSSLQGWPISIWVMRCEKAFQERDHNHLEIRSRWLSTINSRLTEDKKGALKTRQTEGSPPISGDHRGGMSWKKRKTSQRMDRFM